MTATKKGSKAKAKSEVIDPRFLPPPDLPDWIPAVQDFWGKPTETGLEYTHHDTRKKWLETHLTPTAYRCFAAACAKRTLYLFERHDPKELAPRNAIRIALRVNFGMDAAADAAYAAADAVYASYAAGAADAVYAADAADAARAAYAAAYASYAADAAADAADAADAAAYAARAERLNQARLLTLFMAPIKPVVTDTVRGLVRGWQELYWKDIDDQLTRGVLADALEESGFDDTVRLTALRELAEWHPGCWPMLPDIIKE